MSKEKKKKDPYNGFIIRAEGQIPVKKFFENLLSASAPEGHTRSIISIEHTSGQLQGHEFIRFN